MAKQTDRDVRDRLIELLHAASVEVPARGQGEVEALRGLFDPGTDVYVALPPAGDWRDAVATAIALSRAGFNPVPHVPARAIASEAELEDFLARLTGEAGVTKALIIAGDEEEPRGPFAASMDLLQSDALARHPLARVGFAGHPEGHPTVDRAVLEEALVAKIAQARESGCEPHLVTQFCFEPQPVLDWLETLTRLGVDIPVRIGVAGPATATTLLRFAMRCGVGDSLRVLKTRSKTIGRLISETGPEEVLRGVAEGLTERPDPRVEGIHFFPFGGLAKTSDWISDTLSRLYARITPQGD